MIYILYRRVNVIVYLKLYLIFKYYLFVLIVNNESTVNQREDSEIHPVLSESSSMSHSSGYVFNIYLILIKLNKYLIIY